MSIYQFLIAVRQQDGQQLMNDAGETTSHLMGLFYRFVVPFSPPVLVASTSDENQSLTAPHDNSTIRMVENDLKPCYVFDGKPPQLKSNVVRLPLSLSLSFFFFFFPSSPSPGLD